MLSIKEIEGLYGGLSVLKEYPPSGQKKVLLVKHKVHGDVILKVVPDNNDRVQREIQIVTEFNLDNVPKILDGLLVNRLVQLAAVCIRIPGCGKNPGNNGIAMGIHNSFCFIGLNRKRFSGAVNSFKIYKIARRLKADHIISKNIFL